MLSDLPKKVYNLIITIEPKRQFMRDTKITFYVKDLVRYLKINKKKSKEDE